MKSPERLSIKEIADLRADVDTLFIDRDGLICPRRPDGNPYFRAADMALMPEFQSAAATLADRFRYIIVVNFIDGTLPDAPSRAEQEEANNRLRRLIERAGGRVDAFYSDWKEATDDNSPLSSTMLPTLRARRDFPAISFNRSVMIGDDVPKRTLATASGIPFLYINSDEVHERDTARIVEEDLSEIRRSVTSFMEVYTKILNSTTRINGIRLAAQAALLTAENGRNIYLICDSDSGIDMNFLKYHAEYVFTTPYADQVKMISPEPDTTMGAQLAEVAQRGDMAILVSALGNSSQIVEAMNVAIANELVTVSITGARPAGTDLSDIIIKVPSTDVVSVQPNLRLVIEVIQRFVAKRAK